MPGFSTLASVGLERSFWYIGVPISRASRQQTAYSAPQWAMRLLIKGKGTSGYAAHIADTQGYPICNTLT
jgi:hypothetical protein